MSLIKKNEFKQMNEQQLQGKLIELEKELMKLNGQRAMHTAIENPGRVKLIRKTRARIYTRLNEVKRQSKPVVKPVKQEKPKVQEKSKSQEQKAPKKETGGKKAKK